LPMLEEAEAAAMAAGAHREKGAVVVHRCSKRHPGSS